MRKGKQMLAAVLAVIVLVTACGLAGAEQEARKMETAADADEWIGVFLGDAPEKLDGVWAMTLQMQAAVLMLGGMKGLAASLRQLGTVETIGSAYQGELQGYKVFYVPCVFSAMPVDLILATQDGAIAGLSTGAYTGDREEAAASGVFDSMELALPVPALEGELPGTLTVPKGEGPYPAVVLVHGSGCNDRDETIGSLKPFRDLAEGLAERGIAVYRFDKRTFVYGQELAIAKHLTLEDECIEDAVAAVRLLARQEKIDPSRIFVLGHSLGGNAVPAIARALKNQPVTARGYILLAASPRPLDVLMREQYDYLYSLLPEITPEQQAEKDTVFSELDRLKDPDALTEEDVILGVPASYWKWLAAYDIVQAAREITAPCLLLQGEEDYQVTMEDFGLWQDALGDRVNWQLVSCPGLTHAFTPGLKTEGSAAYSRAEKVDAGVTEEIAGFIGRVSR